MKPGAFRVETFSIHAFTEFNAPTRQEARHDHPQEVNRDAIDVDSQTPPRIGCDQARPMRAGHPERNATAQIDDLTRVTNAQIRASPI